MKYTAILLALTFIMMVPADLRARELPDQDVNKIEAYNDLFSYGDYYISAQPSIESLRWLKDQGVTRVVNLRTEKEMQLQKESAFDEPSIAGEMGFEYFNISVKGTSEYSPEKSREVNEVLKRQGKTLIHCHGGGRATQFFMAYLVTEEGYSVSEAVEIGKQMKFSIPLEKLLDKELTVVEKE